MTFLSHARPLQVMVLIGLILVFYTLVSSEAKARPPFPAQVIEAQRNPDIRTLVETSDLIVYAHLDERINKWETGRKLASDRRLVNSRQVIHILNTYKGIPEPPSYLLTTGVEPLPRPGDPLNALYTGPLADGDYVLFLKEYSERPYYTLNGGFSAVYPVYGGKMIALDEGYKELGGKTLSELKDALRH